jgi:hypothetical protein
MVERVLGAPQGGHRGTLVIGGPAGEVAVVLPGESERFGDPAIADVGRLNVEVVVNGDGGQPVAGVEDAMDDGMPPGFDDAGLATKTADQVGGVGGAAQAIIFMCGVVGDARDLHQLAKRALEPVALRTRILEQGFLGETIACHESVSC